MRNSLIAVVALIALGFGGWRVIQSMQSTPNEIVLGEEPEEITYLCLETGKLSLGEWQPMPALNPATGKKTLVQALYCEKCDKWYRAPPAAMAERSPRGPVCPVTGTGLAVEGPISAPVAK
jgi:hypothetical protein